jgi:methanogenic corrinoid protein MtbC1
MRKQGGEVIMAVLEELREIMKEGEVEEVKELVQRALGEGISAQRILDEGLLLGMNELGVQFKNNEVFVPDVLMAARAPTREPIF